MPRHSDFIQHIDKLVGNRIYELRLCMGLSRQQLAEQIDVTHQQLQKYEKGTNRIFVGRLVSIAKALKKPIAYFLENLDENNEDTMPTQHQRMCIEVSRNFMRINNVIHQNAVNFLIRSLADKKEGD